MVDPPSWHKPISKPQIAYEMAHNSIPGSPGLAEIDGGGLKSGKPHLSSGYSDTRTL